MLGMPCLKGVGKVVAGYWKVGWAVIELTVDAARTDALATWPSTPAGGGSVAGSSMDGAN